jgi:hypothetical protein
MAPVEQVDDHASHGVGQVVHADVSRVYPLNFDFGQSALVVNRALLLRHPVR